MRLKTFQDSVKEFIQYTPNQYSPYDASQAPKPPEELILLWRCEKYKALPCFGNSLEDQPHILMICFDIIHEERKHWENIKQTNLRAQQQYQQDQASGIIPGKKEL